MTEEQIREEILLTDEEIEQNVQKVYPGIERCDIEYNVINILLEAQLDKALTHKGIRLEAENQELPLEPRPILNEDDMTRSSGYNMAQQDMLKEGWVKCLRKVGQK